MRKASFSIYTIALFIVVISTIMPACSVRLPAPDLPSSDPANSGESSTGFKAEMASIDFANDPYFDLIVRDSQAVREVPLSITRQQALEDLDVVERIIRRGYAAFETFEAHGIIDWDVFFASLRESIDGGADTVPTNDFWSFFSREFSVIPDAHLGFHVMIDPDNFIAKTDQQHIDVYSTAYYFDYNSDDNLVVAGVNPQYEGEDGILVQTDKINEYDIIEKDLPVGSIVIGVQGGPGVFADKTLIEKNGKVTPKYLLLAVSKTVPESAECLIQTPDGKKSLWVLNLHRLGIAESKYSFEPVFAMDEKSPAGITIRTFDGPYSEEFERFLDSGEALRNEKVIRIDLRGNGGGLIEIGEEWAEKLGLGHLKKMRKYSLYSEVVFQGFVNGFQFGHVLGNQDDQSEVKSYTSKSQLLTGMVKIREENKGEPYRFFDIEEEKVGEVEPENPYRGALVVLVDSQCASSCENLIHVLKQSPGAVVLGENTMGCLFVSHILYFRLPNSRLWMAAGSAGYESVIEADPFIENLGFAPDFWLDTAQPEVIQRKLADCLASPSCGDRIRSFLEAGKMLKARLPGN